MRKIDKRDTSILSKKYKVWVDKLEQEGKTHSKDYRYYDDVVMNLYHCQKGVCAYTEMNICVEALCNENNWVEDVFTVPAGYERKDHLGELDHFDPSLKKDKYWLWNNLFMIEAKINSMKLNRPVIGYLKPDLEDYAPEKYFDYDESTHRFIPNTDIEKDLTRKEIQYMIDDVLCLNHGWIRKERENFINEIKFKRKNGINYKIDRFFTATDWCLNDEV